MNTDPGAIYLLFLTVFHFDAFGSIGLLGNVYQTASFSITLFCHHMNHGHEYRLAVALLLSGGFINVRVSMTAGARRITVFYF